MKVILAILSLVVMGMSGYHLLYWKTEVNSDQDWPEVKNSAQKALQTLQPRLAAFQAALGQPRVSHEAPEPAALDSSDLLISRKAGLRQAQRAWDMPKMAKDAFGAEQPPAENRRDFEVLQTSATKPEAATARLGTGQTRGLRERGLLRVERVGLADQMKRGQTPTTSRTSPSVASPGKTHRLWLHFSEMKGAEALFSSFCPWRPRVCSP
jgi:hypothetical protein